MRVHLASVGSMAITLGGAALALALASCGGSDKGGGGPAIERYVSRVTSADGTLVAQLHAGAPPAAGAGPTVGAASPGAALPGGSKIYQLDASAAFSTVIVAVDGVDGYYQLDGVGTAGALTAAPSNQIVVSISQEAAATFTVHIAVAADGASAPGTYEVVPVTLTQVGTGDVQVSLSWSVPADIDLHVVDPSGEEIYYGNDASASGGVLDLDSNAGCGIDNVDNENITWATGTAPRGTYTVRVDNWDSCTQARIEYVVTVNVKGQATRTFTGVFTDAGDEGGQGDGVTITQFTY